MPATYYATLRLEVQTRLLGNLRWAGPHQGLEVQVGPSGAAWRDRDVNRNNVSTLFLGKSPVLR
jgi:hypothetical protein